MQKLLISLVVLILLLGAAIAYAMLNLNSYLRDNKGVIEEQVEAALGREVSFDEISISFSGGLGARLTKLRIADDPAFAKEPFVAADDVQVVVGILPAFQGNIEVRKVILAEPSLVVIQRDDGFNFDSIGAKGKGEAAPMPTDQAPADPEAAEGASTATFLIAHTEIRDASLRYVDMRSKPGMEFLVQDFDFEASDVSLTSSTTLATAAALFGASDQNVKLSGTIGPVGSPVDTERIPIDLDVRIGPFVIDELKKLALFADAIPPDLESPDPIELTLNVSGTPAKVRITGGFDARSTGIRFGDTFQKPRGTPLALEIDATYAGDSVDLVKLVFRLAGLEVVAGGRYDMSDPDSPRFDFHSKIDGANLKTLLASQMPGAEERIEGLLFADLKLSGAGKEWAQIRDALTGNGQIDVKEGVLKDVNIAEQVLAGATGVPGLSSLISERIRKKYPEIFETGDTKFDKLGGTVVIAGGEARTEDLEISARDYSIFGTGSFFLDNRIDFAATLLLSKGLSTDLISEVKEIQYVADASGRVKIPFKMRGPLPGAKPKPDTQYLGQALGRAVVGKGLEGLFGGKKTAPQGEVESAPGSQPTGQDLMRKGLEGLFN